MRTTFQQNAPSEHCRLGGDSVPFPEPEKPFADGRPAKATEPAPFLGQRDQRRQRKSRKEKNQFPDEAQTQNGNTEKKNKNLQDTETGERTPVD